MKYVLVGAGAIEIALIFLLGRQDVIRAFPTTGLLLFGGAFAVYGIAAGWLAADRTGEGETVGVVAVIWITGLLLRAALFTLEPVLSDDFYRYLWDGHVQRSGINPYLHAPAASGVEGLRTTWHGLINNPTVPTIYPPFAQIAFLPAAMAGSALWILKATWLLCDLLTAVFVTRIAKATGRRPALALLLYLWAPLLVIEVAWSAHLEPLGMAAMMGSVLALSRPGVRDRLRAAMAGFALALAALTKFAPAAALPALVRRRGWTPLLAFTMTVAALYMPYISAGTELFTGLRTYGEHWWFMQGAFSALEVIAGEPMRARQLAGILVLGVVAWTAWKRVDVETALFWTIGTGMIVTPTFHPWYVLWMLPLAALRVNRAWLLLCGLTFLGYFGVSSYQSGGDWLQPGWLRTLLWLPFLFLLVHDFVRDSRSGTVEVLPKGGDAETGVA